MNFKIDLTTKQQELLKQLNIIIENRDYSTEEIKQCENVITSHIMSQSSKNGDLSREIFKYNEIVDKLMKSEC